jgi:hypothetical protein
MCVSVCLCALQWIGAQDTFRLREQVGLKIAGCVAGARRGSNVYTGVTAKRQRRRGESKGPMLRLRDGPMEKTEGKSGFVGGMTILLHH